MFTAERFGADHVAVNTRSIQLERRCGFLSARQHIRGERAQLAQGGPSQLPERISFSPPPRSKECDCETHSILTLVSVYFVIVISVTRTVPRKPPV